MKHLATGGLVAGLALATIGSPVRAQDIEEMVKWTSAQAIRYEVVAEYAGETDVLSIPDSGSSPLSSYRTAVTDRYQLSFDWNPTEMAMIGKPTIENFPSALPEGTPGHPSNGQPCPATRIDGAFDYAEVVDAKAGMPGSNSLELTVKRTYPTGQVPYAAEVGPCSHWLDTPAKTETLTAGLFVPLGMYFAMPQAAGAGLTVGKDGRTMTLVDEPKGWKYTYTLRIVR